MYVEFLVVDRFSGISSLMNPSLRSPGFRFDSVFCPVASLSSRTCRDLESLHSLWKAGITVSVNRGYRSRPLCRGGVVSVTQWRHSCGCRGFQSGNRTRPGMSGDRGTDPGWCALGALPAVLSDEDHGVGSETRSRIAVDTFRTGYACSGTEKRGVAMMIRHRQGTLSFRPRCLSARPQGGHDNVHAGEMPDEILSSMIQETQEDFSLQHRQNARRESTINPSSARSSPRYP